jgi:glucosamine--fructose-6-phosphate aminotransferase (isomerizing)
MTSFEADIRAQGELLTELLTVNRQDELLSRAAALFSPGCPVVFTGMGSSLAAARPAVSRLVAAGLWATATEAGELLHYGLDTLVRGSLVVLVSQSGRSAETLAIGQRLRSTTGTRVIAVVNDLASPLADLGDLVVPMHAGPEVTVSTKTFMATFIAMNALADVLIGASGETINLALRANVASKLASLTSSPEMARVSAARFASVHALVVIGRGPAFAAADYGALILKEATAYPAEAMFAGSFRHGPIEIAGCATGVVVLAPSGPTQSLCVRLAGDTARLGSPTWLLTTTDHGTDARAGAEIADGLVISELPEAPEVLAPLLYCVPIQHLAVELAAIRKRQPGVVERSSKVTAFE